VRPAEELDTDGIGGNEDAPQTRMLNSQRSVSETLKTEHEDWGRSLDAPREQPQQHSAQTGQ
jgi:hypothetical protein